MAQAARKRSDDVAKAASESFHGSFCWNELMTRDIEGAKRFYGDTIGWSFEPMKMDWGTHWLAKAGGKNVGGLFELKGPEFEGVPESWMSYLAVDDVDKRVAKAVKAGAKLMKPIFDVPGVGRIAILMQPGGGGVAWMTPKPNRAFRSSDQWSRTCRNTRSFPRANGPLSARRFSTRRSSRGRATN